MQRWLVRGLVMAVVNGAAQTLLGAIEAGHPTSDHVAEPVTIAILAGVALCWGAIDGWLRKPGRGMVWFYASLIGGLLAGVLGVVGKAAFVDATGVWALSSALTGGAAFTALLILIPAGLGLVVGGKLLAPAGRADEDAAPAQVRSQSRSQSRAQGRNVLRSQPPG
ncbi:MAG TPA: B-4DMT family transporter [Pseudonocardiaceae bacterium]|jgi:hypothetical protein|nr:B-4DMT family transporter [Pseudonocardiaceae bacterium]